MPISVKLSGCGGFLAVPEVSGMTKKNTSCPNALSNQAEYEGQYVAFDPSNGRTVVAHDHQAGKAIAKARALGVEVPAVIFVPRHDVTYIY